MANGPLQVVGVLLTLICFILTFIAACLPYWRSNDIEGEVIETIRRSSGLWTKCTFISTGNWNCDAYDRFFIGLPAALQAARALTIIALFFQLSAIAISFIGLDCTTVAMDQPKLKARCILLAGACNVVGAICIGVAVSWFAANVLYDYHNPLSAGGYNGQSYGATGERYIYGACLFLGWGAMCLGILTGALFCCNSMTTMRDENDQEPYHQGFGSAPHPGIQYQAPKSMGHEYI